MTRVFEKNSRFYRGPFLFPRSTLDPKLNLYVSSPSSPQRQAHILVDGFLALVIEWYIVVRWGPARRFDRVEAPMDAGGLFSGRNYKRVVAVYQCCNNEGVLPCFCFHFCLSTLLLIALHRSQKSQNHNLVAQTVFMKSIVQ